MQALRPYRLLGVGLLFLLSIALIIGLGTRIQPQPDAPTAEGGVLDLSSWDIRTQGIVPLNGEWEFYPHTLLSPVELQEDGAASRRSLIEVPGTWKGESDVGMSKKGIGTYRLKVLLPDTGDVSGLKISSIRMSHRLFVNGEERGASGHPDIDPAMNKPGNTPYTVFFSSDTRELELVLQVANRDFVNGGIVNAISFGSASDIARLDSIQIGINIGIILILALFGAYHLSLYILGQRERAYVYSGLYLLSLMLWHLLYGEKLLQRMLPGLPFELAYKLFDLTGFAGMIAIVLFFCAVEPRLLSPRTRRLLLAPVLLYMAAVVALPYRIHIEYKYVVVPYVSIVVICLTIRMMALAIQARHEETVRKELVWLIGGSLSLIVYLINEGLYAESVLSSALAAKCGVIGFVIFMNILLAIRYTHAFEQSERLSLQLIELNQLKDEFLLNTSHEIKTPLHGAMNMISHVLQDEEGQLSDRQKQQLWLVKDTSMRLSMLIHDLIDVTRLKHGQLRLRLTAVDVRVTVQMVCEMMQFELTGKSVRFDNQVTEGVLVLADENRLRQVLYNLVYNAIRHTEHGSIRIFSSVSGQTVAISVEDTGTGIAKERREAIFTYWEQSARPMPEDGYTGMGIGLYISRKLVEQMGGAIGVAWSELGRGTRMTFTLPLAEASASRQEMAAASERMQRIAYPDESLDITGEHEHTVLIVDDEASNIHTLLGLLRQHRYNVLTAFSAREAMDKLSLHPSVDLIILDVMMPGMSGIELCRTLRSHHSILDLPILFATVKDTPQDIALGFQAGANDYVTKPFEGETLIARVQTLIAMKTSIREALHNEYAFYQAQIKPHFLYNALSSVISFCYTDGEKAAHLLSVLSQFLRHILDLDRSHLYFSLSRELELIAAYIEIEKARFEDRFEFVCEVDPQLHHLEIPALCIQPLVENAIRHGLFEKDGPGTVSLRVGKTAVGIEITVQDDGVGMWPERQRRLLEEELEKDRQENRGIGLANIRKRLGSLPGASLQLVSEPGRGTTVTVLLPAVSVVDRGLDLSHDSS
ncbi:histidine kinase [Paenibacillus sp. 598K]|uniref:hybrid sensor histidine kinase/response regulator n=1 Tax=Paenibacillus sp. 598K TaxID=1117987 RepID=UPI000FF90274|nr:ATP-binding protein [Paenibacillus sp. 598K]GBF76825.1 histidine kinase [Paenibacillus sp. 598K]